jgi:2-C-methyl-D-erythritol 4-phosphate cytidylyltransferase
MRTKAFGDEPSDSLLTSISVARSSLGVLLSPQTGHIVDLRKTDPFAVVMEGDGLEE